VIFLFFFLNKQGCSNGIT